MTRRTVLEVIESLDLTKMSKNYRWRNGKSRNIGIPLPQLAQMKVLKVELDYTSNKVTFEIDY